MPLPTEAFDMQLKGQQRILVMVGHSQIAKRHAQFLSSKVYTVSYADIKSPWIPYEYCAVCLQHEGNAKLCEVH